MPSQKEALQALDQASRASIIDCGVGYTTVPSNPDRRGVIITCLAGTSYVQFGGTTAELTPSFHAIKLTVGDVYELMWYSGVVHVLGADPSSTRITLLED